MQTFSMCVTAWIKLGTKQTLYIRVDSEGLGQNYKRVPQPPYTFSSAQILCIVFGLTQITLVETCKHLRHSLSFVHPCFLITCSGLYCWFQTWQSSELNSLSFFLSSQPSSVVCHSDVCIRCKSIHSVLRKIKDLQGLAENSWRKALSEFSWHPSSDI